jgi:plasmid maintenance system killer protein
VIKSFKHKGLEGFFYDGSRSGINTQHAEKLGRILDRLDASGKSQDMNLPGFRLHELKGKEKGTWLEKENPHIPEKFCGKILLNLLDCLLRKQQSV